MAGTLTGISDNYQTRKNRGRKVSTKRIMEGEDFPKETGDPNKLLDKTTPSPYKPTEFGYTESHRRAKQMLEKVFAATAVETPKSQGQPCHGDTLKAEPKIDGPNTKEMTPQVEKGANRDRGQPEKVRVVECFE